MKRHRALALLVWALCAAALAGVCSAGCRAKRTEPGASPDIAPSATASASNASFDGPALVAEACLACHSDEMLRQQRLTSAQWEKVVKKMAGWGAPVDLKADQTRALVAYLAASYGPDAKPFVASTIGAEAVEAELAPLDDGPYAGGRAARGATLFAGRCAACHGPTARGQIGVSLVDRPLLFRAPEVARAVRSGRGKMPAQPAVTDAELGDLLAYLRTLRARG